MALSQKHAGKILVPWYNSLEWKHVYSLIYSKGGTKSDKQRALEILQVWKARMPILFGGLEGTIIILNAMLLDENVYTLNDLSNLYGLAIMRFLNLCAANSDQGTFFRVVKERNLPDWLVNIRHDLAHSQKESSLYMRKKGIEYCFEWLRREYWEIQDREIADFIVDDDGCDYFDILNTYCELVITVIKQDELPIHIVAILKRIKMSKNINLTKVLKKLFGDKKIGASETLLRLIIEKYLFTIPLEYNCQKIPKVHIQCWNPLIQYMYENNILTEFIKKLNNICCDNKNDNTSYFASLWLNEIFTGLLFEKRATIHKSGHKNSGSVLILHGATPEFLSELSTFANEIIDNPHTYLRNFVVRLMVVCDYKKEYIKLVDSILLNHFQACTEKVSGEDDQPLTVDDINELLKTNILKEFNLPSENEEPIIENRWRKIKDVNIYEGCPIGVLPSQSKELNPLIHLER